MVGVPAVCKECSLVFYSQAVQISGGGSIDASGGVTDCPRCGGFATFVDGNLTERGGDIEILSAPPITYEILWRLKNVAERARDGTITTDEAIKEAEAVSPVLARIFKLFIDAGIPALSILIPLIALYLQHQDGVSQEEFQTEALRLLQRQTIAMETLAERSSQQDRPQNAKAERAAPAKKKARSESVVKKKRSERRKDVRKSRKRELLERRKAFDPSGRHR